MQTRHARKPPVLRVVSARAKPEVVFAVEPFYVIAKELPPLFKKHWRELGRDRESVPLDPDWDTMLKQSISGNLKILTARVDDELVGYVFNLIGPHTHYRSTMHSHADMYWLDPRYRSGMSGYMMLKRNDAEMKKLGVVRRTIAERLGFKGKNGRKTRVLFERLGYVPRDIVFTKVDD